MRRLIRLLAVSFVAVLTWVIGIKLSNDAVGMVVGLIMGILASVPAMLLVLASRQQEQDTDLDYADNYTVVDEHPMQTRPAVQECNAIRVLHDRFAAEEQRKQYTQWLICLLYTSDAADE